MIPLPSSYGGVGDHAASAHHLGQVASRHNSWGLIVDAALEASGAPEQIVRTEKHLAKFEKQVTVVSSCFRLECDCLS